MTDSLRDQLLGLGFKPSPAAPKPERRNDRPGGGNDARRGDRTGTPDGARRNDRAGARQGDARSERGTPPRREDRRGHGKPAQAPGAGAPRHDGARKPRASSEMDLGKAYALRAQKEKDDRIAAEAARQEDARQRREARAKLGEFLKDRALNDKDADIARHFPYGGKIKRIYVNAAQLRALNAGELGVLQLDGRYVLVDAATLAQAEAIFAPSVALRVDPDAPAADDPYADPQFQVPDDLVW